MTILAWCCLALAIVAMVAYRVLWGTVLCQDEGRRLWTLKR